MRSVRTVREDDVLYENARTDREQPRFHQLLALVPQKAPLQVALQEVRFDGAGS